jgi:hypothetical protein
VFDLKSNMGCKLRAEIVSCRVCTSESAILAFSLYVIGLLITEASRYSRPTISSTTCIWLSSEGARADLSSGISTDSVSDSDEMTRDGDGDLDDGSDSDVALR